MARKPTEKQKLAAKPEDEFAGYDVLILNGMIANELFAKITQCLAKNKKSSNILVVLVTYGGQANAAYRISRLLQSMYEDMVVFIPSLCKSAGTLIATSANKLVFSPFGEIGPLDVQLVERDELGERKSGLTMRSALEDLHARSFELFESVMMGIKAASGNNITFKLSAELARDTAVGLMGNIYSQIHPDVLGKDFRDLTVATKYGERLNKKYSNVKEGGIDVLVHGYPSHDFVIDCEEAGEIFERVGLASDRLLELLSRRGNQLMTPRVNEIVVEMENWPANADAPDEDGEANDNRAATENPRAAAE